MKQEAHSWIAVRAVKLLKDQGGNDGLVALLEPHACEASIGAWVPDSTDAKAGGSATENHVLKMKPLKDASLTRFIADKQELLKRLGPGRKMREYLGADKVLDATWWGRPYKATPPKAGQHIANRAMALSTMLKDLLILGDQSVDDIVKRDRQFEPYMLPDVRTRADAAATYFFMLSHFAADACMPCHADARPLAAYAGGLHKEWEESWSKAVARQFERDKLIKKGLRPETCMLGPDLVESSGGLDKAFGLKFDKAPIPEIPAGRDAWMETVDVCRGAFALCSIVAPEADYPYDYKDKKALAPFSDVLQGKPLLRDMNEVVMHDAVLNTAILWQDIWKSVAKKTAKKNP